MKRFAWLGLTLLGGCSLILGIEDLPGGGGDGGIRDGGPDATPPPPAVLAIETERYDMGAALVGVASTPGRVRVTNAGTTRTGKLRAMFGNEAFTGGGECLDAELDPGASCDLEITFTPGAVAAFETTLAVTAYGGGGVETLVLGEGLAGGTLRGDPALDFGAIGIDLGGVPRDVSVTNPDAPTLSGPMTVRVTGQDAGWFALSRNECGAFSLAAGGECQLRLRPVARRTGNARAVLAITSANGGAWVMPLTASGFATGGLTLTATNLNFPSTAIGGTSPAQSIMITNSGAIETGPITAEWTGGAFVVSSNGCAAGLLPATSCTVEIVAQPTAGGYFFGNLRLAGASSGAAMVTASVTVPAAGILDVAPSMLVAPAKQIGTTPVAKTTFRIFNRGATPLAAPTVVSSNPGEFAVATTCPGLSVNGGNCTVTVTFAPIAVGKRDAVITVTSGDQMKTVEVTGTGREGTLGRFLDTMDFGVVNTGSFQDADSTMQNLDTSAVAVTAIMISNPRFAVINGPGVDCEIGGAEVPPMGTCELSVRFSPTEPGVQVGIATLMTDNPMVLAIVPMYAIGRGQISIATDGTWSIYPPPDTGSAICSGAGSCIRQMVDPAWQATYVPAPELAAPFPRQNWGSDPDPICDGGGRAPCGMTWAGRASYNGTHTVPPLVSGTVTGSGAFIEDPSAGILCPPLCEGRARGGVAARLVIRTVDAFLTASSCGATNVCEGAFGTTFNATTTAMPAWTTRHAGSEGLADEALAVTIRATNNQIYATGFEGKAANGTELLLLDLAPGGALNQTVNNNYLGDDRGQDLLVRADNTVVVSGTQGFGSVNAGPLLVSFSNATPAVPTTLPVGATASLGLERLAVTAASMFTLSPVAGMPDTILRRWDATNVLTNANDPRRWTAVAAHRTTDHAVLAGSYMGNLVIGKLSNAPTFDWTQTRVGGGDPLAAALKTYATTGEFVVVLTETVPGRGTNVRLVQYSEPGTTEIATAVFDSGPDSADVAIDASLDSAGQINVLGKTGETYWVRRWSRTLAPVRRIDVAPTGAGMVLYDLTNDNFGNLVLVGSDEADGTRDALVRKIGP